VKRQYFGIKNPGQVSGINAGFLKHIDQFLSINIVLKLCFPSKKGTSTYAISNQRWHNPDFSSANPAGLDPWAFL
jgi:hypothetical protein